MAALSNGGSLRGAWIRLFSDALSFRRLPMPRKGFFMLTIDIGGCADGELDQAISLLCKEREKRCRIAAPSDEGKIEITKLGNITFTNLGNGFMMKPERRAESNEPIARARTQGHQKHGNQA